MRPWICRAVEIAGCEMSTRLQASVMLPVSAAATKYESCVKLNFTAARRS
jgi:hypothetical protein